MHYPFASRLSILGYVVRPFSRLSRAQGPLASVSHVHQMPSGHRECSTSSSQPGADALSRPYCKNIQRAMIGGSAFTTFLCAIFVSRYQIGRSLMSCGVPRSPQGPYQRLPLSPRPTHYRLLIEPNLKDFSYVGQANIDFEVLDKPVNEFSVYSTELEVSIVTIKSASQGASDPKCQAVNVTSEKDERIRLSVADALAPGMYTLSMAFKGVLNDKMNGFYRSTYKGEDGTTDKVMALTQFEPVYARRAFPCWDEPSFKATFDVSIIVPDTLVALSNMPVSRIDDVSGRPGLKQFFFDTSPKMSTYLLAFIVGDLGFTETVDANGINVRVYTRRGCEEQGRFSLEVAAKVLPYYATYFDIEYPLPKLDLVAVPDFAAGAMENWGLITYRDSALLVDPNNTSKASKQYVALVVGHELAHQWFGNLVTMDWWTDLWLNEGFASWIEFLSVDSLFPQLDIWTQFVFTDLRRALEMDGLQSSHPIEVPVGSPDEIDQIFDSISYSKGASIIRMLHDYMGNENFKAGLRTYLKQFKYANAETKDLWKHLTAAAHQDIGSLMHKWTRHMGYPLVTVESMKQIDLDLELSLVQGRFLIDGEATTKTPGDAIPWRIPISVRFASKPEHVSHKFVFSELQSKIVIPQAAKEDWIKINADSVGFYITQYPPSAMDHLIKAVPHLTKLDRFGLQSDLSMLCKAGLGSYVDYLKLTRAYSKQETDYTVWRDIISTIGSVQILVDELDKPDILNKLDAFEVNLLTPIFEKLGWEASPNEDDLTSMLRGVIFRVLGMANHSAVVNECIRLFELNESIDPNLRSAVYSVVAKTNKKYLHMLMARHQAAELSEEKNRILSSMGMVKDPESKRQVLEYTIGEHVRYQDVYFGFMSVASADKEGCAITWKFFKENFGVLCKRYRDTNMLGTLIKRSLSSFCNEKAANEIKAFFDENQVPNAKMVIDQVLETIKTNSQAFKRDGATLEKFLSEM